MNGWSHIRSRTYVDRKVETKDDGEGETEMEIESKRKRDSTGFVGRS